MARKKRWTETTVKDGTGEIRFSAWRYFLDYVYQQMLDFDEYIWRGHRNDDFKLEPTLDRLIRRNPSIAGYAFRSSHLERFKFAVRGRRGTNPAILTTENDWWALGQHHGLATPLLDWTQSPFAAAYFAFMDVDTPQTAYRAIYALHRPTIESRADQLAREERDRRKQLLDEAKTGAKTLGILQRVALEAEVHPEVEFFRPLSDENQRLVNQAGLFSRAPNGVALEDWVRKNFPERRDYILMKCLIPNTDRQVCLRMLNRMNINHLTLFPDLYGSSVFVNFHGTIAKY